MSNNEKLVSNFECDFKSGLCQKEIEVLKEIVRIALQERSIQTETDTTYLEYGTVIIDGQKYSYPAACIMRFNLLKGPIIHDYGEIGALTSDCYAATSINNILEYPRSKRIFAPALTYSGKEKSAPAGYYHNGHYRVAVLDGEYGRFLIGIEVEENDPERHSNEMILVTLLAALGGISPNDKRLAQSIKIAHQQITDSCGGVLTQLSIQSLFQRTMNGEAVSEAFSAWYSWYQRTQREKFRG